MTEKDCIISFPNTTYSAIVCKAHQNLSEILTVQNSPVLFGCRTGICGTCLVAVIGKIPLPSVEEKEILMMIAPHQQEARLACQLDLTSNIEIRKLEPN